MILLCGEIGTESFSLLDTLANETSAEPIDGMTSPWPVPWTPDYDLVGTTGSGNNFDSDGVVNHTLSSK